MACSVAELLPSKLSYFGHSVTIQETTRDVMPNPARKPGESLLRFALSS